MTYPTSLVSCRMSHSVGDMLDTYALRVVEAAVDWNLIDYKPSGRIESHKVAAYMLMMPHGAVYQEGHSVDLEALFIIGQDRSLQEHYNINFVQGLKETGVNFVQRMCCPYIISGERLMHLDEWPEWKMLEGFLNSKKWNPILTFKNTPIRVKELNGPGYLCDIRIIPHDDIPVWLP